MKHLTAIELDAYLDGALSPDALAKVRSHLEICVNCRQQETVQRILFDKLKKPLIEPIPVDLAPTVMAQIQHETLPVPAGFLLAAEAVGAILLAIWLWPQISSQIAMTFSVLSTPVLSLDLATIYDVLRAWQGNWTAPVWQFNLLNLGPADWVTLIVVGAVIWLAANRLLSINLFRMVKNSPEASS